MVSPELRSLHLQPLRDSLDKKTFLVFSCVAFPSSNAYNINSYQIEANARSDVTAHFIIIYLFISFNVSLRTL